MKLTAILIAAATMCTAASSAQSKLWGGLTEPQPQHEIPVGRASVVWPEKAKKLPRQNSSLKPDGQIVGGWELSDGGQKEWFDAVVPGTVLTTLVERGVYPDPYYGLNNLAIPDSLARTDWWYRTKFAAPKMEGRAWLLFEGINYRAEVWLNGRQIGRIDGAFIRGRFEVTGLLKKTNELRVHILPPDNPCTPHEQSMKAGQGLNGGSLSLDGPTFISSVGWDWIPGIRDRNVGIWQPVRLVQSREVTLGDPLIATDLPLPDTTLAVVHARVPVRNVSDKRTAYRLTMKIGENSAGSKEGYLEAGEEVELYMTTGINNPRLWWPNGYGGQNLYEAEVEVTIDGAVSDSKKISFGVREYSYELMVGLPDGTQQRVLYTPMDAAERGPVFDYVNRVSYNKSIQLPTIKSSDARYLRSHGVTMLSSAEDKNRAFEPFRDEVRPIFPDDNRVGPYLAIRVNGQRVFCRGGNWGMDDGMKRVAEERLEPYFRLQRNAGFNIIRNWTGESTEEAFYALCDRYGMMVWNDFWITTDDTVSPVDAQLFMRNAEDAVRRFANHPSIVVWGPRNEGFAPENLEHLLPEMMARVDPTRHYHGQSRYLNMDSSGPWSYKNPVEYYDMAKGFLTEIGSFAIPTAESIRKFIAPEDRWPINDVWAYHDLHHTSQNFKGFLAAVERYGKPTSMEDFERKAQLVCYDAWRAIMEAWNSRMWASTSGQILWMSHPAWPSMIWQTYTWDGQTPGSYYGAKKACEPLHVQFNLNDETLSVVNNTRRDVAGLVVRIKAIDPLTGRILDSGERSADKHSQTRNVAAAGITQVGPGQLTFEGVELPSLYLLRLELLDGGRVISTNDYWRAKNDSDYARMNEIPAARLEVRRDGAGVVVRNVSNALAVNVRLGAPDFACVSDGYFNLLPGEERRLTVELPAGVSVADFETTMFNQ